MPGRSAAEGEGVQVPVESVDLAGAAEFPRLRPRTVRLMAVLGDVPVYDLSPRGGPLRWWTE